MAVKADISSKEDSPEPTGPVPDIIQESISITALATIGQQAALLSNLSTSNSVLQANLAQQSVVGHGQALAEVGVTVTGKCARLIEGLGPLEAKGSLDYMTVSSLAEQIADLKAAAQAFAGGGGPGPVPPSAPIYLPSNPLGPPYHAVAPTHLHLTNVKAPQDLNVEKTVEGNRTVVKFTAREPIPLPPFPRGRIPNPIPAKARVFAHVPLLLSYDNDHGTRTIEVSNLTADKVVEISEETSPTT